MVYRSALSFALVALVLPILGCTEVRHRRIVEGSPLPPSIASLVDEANAPSLLWVLSEEDCISCTAGVSAAVVRRLSQRFGAALQTTLVLVGTDSATVRNVLRNERLQPRIMLAPRELVAEVGTTPMLMLVHSNRVVSVAHLGSDAVAANSEEERLMTSLSPLIGGGATLPLAQEDP